MSFCETFDAVLLRVSLFRVVEPNVFGEFFDVVSQDSVFDFKLHSFVLPVLDVVVKFEHVHVVLSQSLDFKFELSRLVDFGVVHP